MGRTEWFSLALFGEPTPFPPIRPYDDNATYLSISSRFVNEPAVGDGSANGGCEQTEKSDAGFSSSSSCSSSPSDLADFLEDEDEDDDEEDSVPLNIQKDS